MEVVPLKPVPAQEVNVTLGDQVCTVKICEKYYGLFLDLSIEDTPILNGIICQNRNRIVRDKYRGFLGDLVFIDTQGSSDPDDYTGIGSRYLLLYLTPDDLAALGLAE